MQLKAPGIRSMAPFRGKRDAVFRWGNDGSDDRADRDSVVKVSSIGR